MDVPGLLVLLLLGSSVPALAVPRDFHLIDQLKNWTEAQTYCRDHFLDLATIETAEEWSRVQKLVVGSAHQDAWIGLYDEVDTWRWSQDDSLVSEREAGTWFQFNIASFSSRYSCAYLWYGILRDGDCEWVISSACYDETSNSIYATPSWMSWSDAQAYCRSTYTDLASVKTQQDLTQIRNSVDDASHWWWVGLHRRTWRWSEYGGPSTTVWWPGEPDGSHQHCASAGAQGSNSTACDQLRPFICSGPAKQVIRITLKTDGAVDLNDPLVQEALLKQMEQDLRGQGVTQEFRLRWRKQPHGDAFNKTL